MSAQKQAVPQLIRRSLRRRQQSGLAKKLEAPKVLPQRADGGNTLGMLFRFITTMNCKPSKQNRRDFCNFFLLRRVPRHDDAIAHYPSRGGMSIAAICMRLPKLKRGLRYACVFLFVAAAEGQIQVDLKFKRMQYIAYEPVVATLASTNLAGRDIELHDANGQSWLGFEVTGYEDQPIAPLSGANREPPLRMQAGQRVTRQIDLTPLYPVNEFGAYHVRTNIYFADLGKFFYSGTRVFEVTDARPIWQQTVGVPEGTAGSGEVRTYSLMTNRFPDHTSLYVRVQDKGNGVVYATYSSGRTISFEQ